MSRAKYEKKSEDNYNSTQIYRKTAKPDSDIERDTLNVFLV